MVFFLKLAFKLLYAQAIEFGTVGSLFLALDRLGYVVLAYNLLHFGEGGVSRKRNLIAQLLDCVCVQFSLG